MVFHFIGCYSFYYLVHFLNIKIYNIMQDKLDPTEIKQTRAKLESIKFKDEAINKVKKKIIFLTRRSDYLFHLK